MSVTPRLQVTDTTGRHVVPIDKPVFRIGRRGESDLRLVGGDVSREHAEIERDDTGRCLLRDRGSRCGTFVNNEPVTERVLVHGDEIRLGRSAGAELIFLLDDSVPVHGSNTSAIVDFRQISSLLDGLRALGPARVLDDVLALVMDSAIEVTGAERGFIMLADEAGELEFKIGRGARPRAALRAVVRDQPEDSAAGVRHRARTDRDGSDGRQPGGAASGHRRARDPPRAVHAASRHSLRRQLGRAAGAAADRRAVSRRPRKGEDDVGGDAPRARRLRNGGRGRDRQRSPVPRVGREEAARTRAAARRGDSAGAPA